MQTEFLMRSVCYDSVLLTDKTQYDIFVDSDDEIGERISQIAEKEIVSWFFNHPMNFKDYLFYEELGIDKDKYKPFFEISKPLILDNEKPGDLDILLINKAEPQRSVAIQVKRVKATIDKNDNVFLQTKHIQKGILQTKRMYQKYKFHQCYLMLVIVADAKNRLQNQQMFRHLSYQEKEVVYFHSGYGDLPEDVGVYFLEISQPSTNEIGKTAQISSKMQIAARPLDQLNDTTERVLQFIKTDQYK